MIANFIMAGVNMLEGFAQSEWKTKLAKAQYKLDSTRADIKTWQTASNNLMAMSDASARDFEMKRQQKKQMDAYGEQVSQEAWNASKQADQMNRSRFESSLQNAGNLGSIIAAAAAAGVGGSSVEDAYNAEQLRQTRQDEQASRDMSDWQYSRNLNQISMMDNAFNSLEVSAGQFANLTYAARDMVTDNSWQHKWSIGKGVMDGVNGFMGNMDKVGVNVGGLMGQGQAAGAASQAWSGVKGMFSGGGGTGGANMGLGQGGKTRL